MSRLGPQLGSTLLKGGDCPLTSRNFDPIFFTMVSILPGVKVLMALVFPLRLSVIQVVGQVRCFPYKTAIVKEEKEERGQKKMRRKERGRGGRGPSLSVHGWREEGQKKDEEMEEKERGERDKRMMGKNRKRRNKGREGDRGRGGGGKEGGEKEEAAECPCWVGSYS